MRILSFRLWLLFGLFVVLPGLVAAGQAGSVVFATGKPVAISEAGKSTELKRGNPFFSGDTLKTRQGLLQLRFTDGGFMSLKPGTTLKLDEYAFNEAADGSEKHNMTLVDGGLRTITGKIGKKNRNAYSLKTRVATIGIRGTKYRVELLNGLSIFMGEDGALDVFNEVGSFSLSAQDVAFLGGQQEIMKLLSTGDLAAVETQLQEQLGVEDIYSIADEVDSSGEVKSIVDGEVEFPPAPVLPPAPE